MISSAYPAAEALKIAAVVLHFVDHAGGKDEDGVVDDVGIVAEDVVEIGRVEVLEDNADLVAGDDHSMRVEDDNLAADVQRIAVAEDGAAAVDAGVALEDVGGDVEEEDRGLLFLNTVLAAPGHLFHFRRSAMEVGDIH